MTLFIVWNSDKSRNLRHRLPTYNFHACSRLELLHFQAHTMNPDQGVNREECDQ
jgi:hypothetical protein